MATKNSKKSRRKERLSKTKTPVVKQQISIYDKWIVYLCAAILITVPLAVSLISYDNFDIVKLVLFRILVAGIVIAWVKKFRTESESFIWSWREVLLGSFLLLLVLSTIFSIHFLTSLLGRYKRYEGLLTFITYITLYFIVMQVFKKKDQLRLMIEVTSIVGGLVSIYGILQNFGWDPLNEIVLGERSSSTFGNADLLGGYLVLALPCAIAAYLGVAKRRWLHILMALLIAVCLYTSFTRGSWIGAFAAVICFAVMLGWKGIKTRWREIAIIGAPLIIVIVSLITYLLVTSSVNSSTQKKGAINRLKVYDLKNIGGENRIETWKAGLQMIKDRPLLGQGPDTYRVASEHFQTKAEVRMTSGQYVSENAHNYFIQLAALMGPLAAIIIFVFFGSWIVRSVKAKRKLEDDDEDRILISAVIAAVVGYLVNMVFGISIVGASSVFWLLMAVVTGYTYKVEPFYKKEKILDWPRSIKISLATGMVVLTIVNAGIAVAMYAGDIYFAEGIIASARNDFNVASANFDKAAVFYPGNGRFMFKKGQMYHRLAGAAKDTDKQTFTQYLEESVKAFEKAIDTEPLEVDYKVFLAFSYASLGQVEDAKSLLDVVLDRSPYCVSAHLDYGEYELQLNNKENALKHYEDAVDLSPTKAYPDIYENMAVIYKEIGDSKKASIFKKASLSKDPVAQQYFSK